MSDLTDYAENAIANHFFRGSATAASTAYVGLMTANAGEASAGTEGTTTIRTAGRVAAGFGAPSNGVISNTADVDFGAAAGGATITGFALYDAATAGNILAYKAFGTARVIQAGDLVRFPAGSLTVTIA